MGYRLDRLPAPRTELTEALGRQSQPIPKGLQEPVQDSQTEILKAGAAPTKPAPWLPTTGNRESRLAGLDRAWPSLGGVLKRRLARIEKRLRFDRPAAEPAIVAGGDGRVGRSARPAPPTE